MMMWRTKRCEEMRFAPVPFYFFGTTDGLRSGVARGRGEGPSPAGLRAGRPGITGPGGSGMRVDAPRQLGSIPDHPACRPQKLAEFGQRSQANNQQLKRDRYIK